MSSTFNHQTKFRIKVATTAVAAIATFLMAEKIPKMPKDSVGAKVFVALFVALLVGLAMGQAGY